MPTRDDFSEEVKRVLANRAANICSNPHCMATTSGPQEDPTKALNIGVAAHITAASPGGARYDDNLTSEQRKDARNGIWLFQNCAKLVDNDDVQFSAEYLRAWKTVREHETRLNIGQTAPRFESESARKAREISKWVGKVVMYVIPPLGDLEYTPHPVTLLNATEFYVLFKGDGWNQSKSIPMEQISIGWNERMACIELRDRNGIERSSAAPFSCSSSLLLLRYVASFWFGSPCFRATGSAFRSSVGKGGQSLVFPKKIRGRIWLGEVRKEPLHRPALLLLVLISIRASLE